MKLYIFRLSKWCKSTLWNLMTLIILTVMTKSFAVDFPYSEWSLGLYEGAYATISEGTVAVANGGSDYWHVQLIRRSIELLNGKTYELKFFLQGVGNRKVVEVRVGRDGAPYDAFAEFGEIAATVNGRIVTKTFTMNSGNVENARLEFNLGKNAGTVYFSDVSLSCLDCGSSAQIGPEQQSPADVHKILNYAVVADEIDFRDYSMALGDVFGAKIKLGADTKIYGDVESSNTCDLRVRAYVFGDLLYSNPCTEQIGVIVESRKQVSLAKPIVVFPDFSAGVEPISVNLDESVILPPGNYGTFYANARSKVTLSSGSYTFQSFFTEPDVQFTFDMTSGPVSIAVAGNVRFGDRNRFAIIDGSPNEISWNIAGSSVKLGTDGLYFGSIIAPFAYVDIPSRSHLVGGVYANKFKIEPQSTVSQQPRIDEISHSEEHFGPFFEPGVYRFRSVLSMTTESVEMYVYSKNSNVKINGGDSRVINLSTSNTTVNISVSRDMISGFPVEAFSSNYRFEFVKNSNYRVYWNPQTPCKEGCDGSSVATAIGNFETVLEIAKTTGREINMAGGTWNAAAKYSDGIVPWKVGFELVGYAGDIWELSSENELPQINLGGISHIEIEGRSPRSFTGLRIANGANMLNGGAINAENQKVDIKNVIISDSKANGNGGALFATGTLNLENVRFSGNAAMGDGGAVVANDETNMLNVIFMGNLSAKNGGAVELASGNAYIGNAIFYNNSAAGVGGAVNNDAAKMDLWNSTFFANGAVVSNAAIGGNANGTIGNSIFWKNGTSSCNPGECADEVVKGYHAMNSSFSKGYSNWGEFIYSGDPKFADESNPMGENLFMGYDAGINLSSESHLVQKGTKNAKVPLADIIGSERNQESVPLGPYGFVLKEGGEAFIGVLGTDGLVKPMKPAIPLIDQISGDWYQNYLAKSPYARVLKASVKKHSKTNVGEANVTLWVKDVRGVIRTDVKPVSFKVYRVGEENGKYVFQTMTQTKGKPIVFSSHPEDVGNFDNVIVVCMKELSDYFYIKASAN